MGAQTIRVFKMAADRMLVLNDLLCFLSSRYGKWELRSIKTVLLSFYSSENISAAKELFFVHVTKRRQSVEESRKA